MNEPTPPASTLPRFDSPQQEAFLNLWRTYDRLRALEDALFSRFELSPQQYNVLRLLHGAHPKLIPTLAIAERLISRSPDITRIIDKLEQRKWIHRERPEYDRRTVLIGITEEGLALLTSIHEPLHDCHMRQLGHLSSVELSRLVELLSLARTPHETDASNWK